MPRRTFEEIRAEARRERDGDNAAYVERYAACVKAGGTAVNPLAYPEEIRDPLVSALRAVASSIRAGLADGGGG